MMAEEEAKGEIKRKSTSIKVDPELWKDVKIEAIKQGIELSELVESALKNKIEALRKND